ncbi:TPR repeat-containing protein [Calothrix sp. NIES-2100]|nr:TPR repeat-containing protein [Calothrix sp. NIES-2100]
MKRQKLSHIAFITLLATLLTSFSSNLPIFTASQVLAQTANDRKAEADRLLNQGIEQAQTSQFEAAIQSWEKALIIYREIKDRKSEGSALNNLGNVYKSLGDYPKAIDYLQQSLAIAREIKDRLGEGRSLGNIGSVYSSLGDYTKAIDYQQQSLAILREKKDRKSEGQLLGNLGLTYRYLGDYPKAIEYYQQSLAIKREIKDRLGEGTTLNNLGVVYQSLGDYPKAIDYHQKSLAIAREIKDRLGEGNALGNLGNAYQSLGDYPKAIDYHQRRLAIAKEIKDRQGEGQSLGNLSLAYFSLGNYTTAIDYQQQSLVIAREIKDRLGEGNALGNLGNAYLSLGEYQKAINYYQQSLAIAQEIKDRQGEGTTLGNLSSAYYYLGNYPKAIDYIQQRLVISREIKDRYGEGQSLGNLGVVYQSLGDYPKAIEQYQQSLKIRREIKDRQGEGQSLDNLGVVYDSLGDYPKAINYHQQSLAIAREIKDLKSQGLSLNNLGAAFYKSGNLSAAEKTLYEGIKVLESLRGQKLNDTNKVSIFETQRSTYRILQQVLIAQNKNDAALEISERGRARAFVELISSRLNYGNGGAKSSASPTLAQMKQIAEVENATLVQYSIIYNDFKVAGKPQSKESELYIWVIKPTGEVIFRKADLKPLWQKENTNLDNLVTISRDAIGARGRGGINVSYNPNAPKAKDRLKQLHELLIKPIADVLPTKESDRVIFAPQDSLFLVPFPALQDENGKYLIEKHTILTSPSIQVLQLTHQQRNLVSGKEALVVGNPKMPKVAPKIGETPQQLPPLPGAEQEAKAIASLLKTTAITGSKATKAAILRKISQARIVHLATHGLLDDFKGLGVPGAISLAPSGQDNGLLTSNEILDLKLNAELVVLSACDTGRGTITGDGVIGLSRALITAGVPSVLVSLWSIPDSPTALLMTEFYQDLQKNPDKAQALREAMLNTMKQHPNPRDWAAFTLIGEAE